MSATDLLRDALERIAGSVGQFADEMHASRGAVGFLAMADAELRERVGDFLDVAAGDLKRAREALAAVPAEPVEGLYPWPETHAEWIKGPPAVPVEPEEWEWRAGYSTWATKPRASKSAAWAACERFRGFAPEWFERRRPGTAPGPWERVDPEPRLQDGEP